MALRFEFDQANKILLLHLEGQLLNESVAESYRAIRKYWTKTGACMGIVNFSSVTEFALSGDLIIQLAQQEPCMPDGTSRARVIVAPETHVYGLARMYQILAENTRPALSIVHTLGEAFEVLGVQSPHFEPCKENFLVTDEMAFD
jgi:hypothetical protein